MFDEIIGSRMDVFNTCDCKPDISMQKVKDKSGVMIFLLSVLAENEKNWYKAKQSFFVLYM